MYYKTYILGVDGDFLVQTEGKIFYGKEGYLQTAVTELDLQILIGLFYIKNTLVKYISPYLFLDTI